MYTFILGKISTNYHGTTFYTILFCFKSIANKIRKYIRLNHQDTLLCNSLVRLLNLDTNHVNNTGNCTYNICTITVSLFESPAGHLQLTDI